jgi:glycosyltransferase 2 family protein
MTRGKRKLTRWLWPALALLLLFWVLRAVELREVWQTLRALDLQELGVLALVNALILITLTGRWWLLLAGLGYTIPFFRLVSYRLAAFGISYFTPGPHFGGEPLQVYLLAKRHQVPTSTAIAAVSLDKLLELVVNFTFLTTGALLVLREQFVAVWLERQLVFYSILLLAAPLFLVIALWRGRHPISGAINGVAQLAQRHTGWRWPTRLLHSRGYSTLRQSEIQATRLCRRRPRYVLLAMAISLASWVGVIFEFWLMTEILGLQLTPVESMAALLAARIAILLPMPAGLGALEASQALAMNSLSINPAKGVAISLLIRMRDVLIALLGLWFGGANIWRPVRYSPFPQPVDDPAGSEPPSTSVRG